MHLEGRRYDHLMIPLVLTDPKGRILYKNDLAKEMDILRVGSSLLSRLDERSKFAFVKITAKGTFLTLLGELDAYRALAFPVTLDHSPVIALLFPDVLLGRGQNTENEEILLRLSLPLAKMLKQMQEDTENFLDENERKSFFVHRTVLMRKLLDLYLSYPVGTQGEEIPQNVNYFISVISFFYREVFRHQNVFLSMSQTAKECGYVFYDHKSLTALLLSLIELLIERTETSHIHMDIYSEAANAVISLVADLKTTAQPPDDSMPDAFILFELCKRKGIEIEMFCSENGEEKWMVCRLLLPSRIAKNSFAVFSADIDAETCVADFLEYLAG